MLSHAKRTKLFNDNVKLVYHAVHKYINKFPTFNVDIEDLKQEALLFFWRGLEKYDPEKGTISNYLYTGVQWRLGQVINRQAGAVTFKGHIMSTTMTGTRGLLRAQHDLYGALGNGTDMENKEVAPGWRLVVERLLSEENNLVDMMQQEETRRALKKALEALPEIERDFFLSRAIDETTLEGLAAKYPAFLRCKKTASREVARLRVLSIAQKLQKTLQKNNTVLRRAS